LRVPKPWPARIFVSIKPFNGDPSDFTQSPWDSDNLDNPIKVLVKRIEDRTKTVLYDPVGDQEYWQIGSPYIPASLIPPNSPFLIIEIEWDLQSKWQDTNVKTYREDMES
jgi:hypothetical protein